MRRRVLVLYSGMSTHISAVKEYLDAIAEWSAHEIYFFPEKLLRHAPDPNCFDAIVVHWSARMCLEWAGDLFPPGIASPLTAYWREVLPGYKGAKLLFIQDEYEGTEYARRWIDRFGFDAVFTCTPAQSVELVYPAERFPNLLRVPVLTGYVAGDLAGRTKRPIRGRPNAVVYRGRALPSRCGVLGFEKAEIGRRMRAEAERRGVAVDIEWTDEKRIYGDAYYDFMASGKTTLISESGSTVFDEDGWLIRTALRLLKIGFDDDDIGRMLADDIAARERPDIGMGQVPPKVFQAAALGTAIVAFPAPYSGVIEPERHYIPLARDFSNTDEVFERLTDEDALQAMADRLYEDVIASDRWSYQRFVRDTVDSTIEACCARSACQPEAMSPETITRVTRKALGREDMWFALLAEGAAITIPLQRAPVTRVAERARRAAPWWHRLFGGQAAVDREG